MQQWLVAMMIKIEARKLDRNSRPLRPPKWGSQTTEEQETPGAEPSGKPSTTSFPGEKYSRVVVYLIIKGVPAQILGGQGLCTLLSQQHSLPQATIRTLELNTHSLLGDSKPTISSPIASHYWYQNSEGLVGMNLKFEILMAYDLSRSPPVYYLVFPVWSITPSVWQLKWTI